MPYLTNICQQARETGSSNLVITRGFHDMMQAEFVRDWMEKEGTKVVFVELQISDEEFVARMKFRHRKQAAIIRLSMKDFWETRVRVTEWGEFNKENEEKFIRSLLIGWEDTL